MAPGRITLIQAPRWMFQLACIHSLLFPTSSRKDMPLKANCSIIRTSSQISLRLEVIQEQTRPSRQSLIMNASPCGTLKWNQVSAISPASLLIPAECWQTPIHHTLVAQNLFREIFFIQPSGITMFPIKEKLSVLLARDAQQLKLFQQLLTRLKN